MELVNNPRRKVLTVIAVAVMVLAAGMVALLAVSTSATADPSSPKFAFARIMDADGDVIGAAMLTQRKDEVRVFAWTKGLTPGKHGIHIHAVGLCDPAAFATAGGHFNPEARQHGLENPAGARRRPAEPGGARERHRHTACRQRAGQPARRLEFVVQC